MNAALIAMRLVDAVAFILYVLILARILLSWLPVNPWNPFVALLRRIVDPILRPFRRLLPALGGIDLSPLVAILVIFFVSRLVDEALGFVAFGGNVNIAADIIVLIVQLIENVIIILGILVLLRLLVALFAADPWHPLVAGLRSMTNPLVRPFSRLGPTYVTHGLDVPALATLVAYVIAYVVVAVVFGQLLVQVV